MHDDLFYYLALILVPVFPAFAMFKWLPSDVQATGPFGGLKWKLGGAFGGYFLILLFSYPLVGKMMSSAHAQRWIITGRVMMEDQAVSPVGTELLVHPPHPNVEVDGRFSLELLIPDRPPASPIDITSLVVVKDGYRTQSIPIDAEMKPPTGYVQTDYKISWDAKTHLIHLGEPIVMHPGEPSKTTNLPGPPSDYNASAPPPQQLPE